MIEVLGKKDCNNCNNLKGLLTRKGIEFKYQELTEDELFEKGFNSVPQCLINGKWNSYVSTVKMVMEGNL